MTFFAIYNKNTGKWINSYGSKSSMGWFDAPKLFAERARAQRCIGGIRGRRPLSVENAEIVTVEVVVV